LLNLGFQLAEAVLGAPFAKDLVPCSLAEPPLDLWAQIVIIRTRQNPSQRNRWLSPAFPGRINPMWLLFLRCE